MTQTRSWSRFNEKTARRIAADIEKSIRQGFYPSGSKIPDYRALQAMYHVGQHTLTRVREILVHKNLVKVIRGTGTFVR
jgi:DNA-binding GntR family transcriptional regulator